MRYSTRPLGSSSGGPQSTTSEEIREGKGWGWTQWQDTCLTRSEFYLQNHKISEKSWRPLAAYLKAGWSCAAMLRPHAFPPVWMMLWISSLEVVRIALVWSQSIPHVLILTRGGVASKGTTWSSLVLMKQGLAGAVHRPINPVTWVAKEDCKLESSLSKLTRP